MANRLGQVLTNFGYAVVASAKGLSLRDPLRAWLLGESFDSGAKHVSDPYKQAVYVHTAISTLAQLVAGVPLDVLDRDETPIDNPDDESVRLLHKPNSLNDQRTFFERTVILKARHGQVFWVKPKTFARPLERAVYVIPSHEMTAEAPDGVLVGWTWTRRGRREFLELDRVCRMFQVDPDDELGGFPGVRAAQLSIDAHTHAARHNVNMFYNGAEPGSVYTTDKMLTPDQREQIEGRIKSRHGGVENVKKPMVLYGGLKRDPIQTNSDLEYIEGQRLTAHQQIAPLHVQPIYAALFENVNYNTANVQERLQWDLAVLPELKHLVACWNMFAQAFVDAAKTVVPNLDAVPVLQEREIERTERVLKLQDQGVPLNVLIDVYGLKIPPQPWGDEPLVGAGQLPISVVYGEAEAAIAADNEPEGDKGKSRKGESRKGEKAKSRKVEKSKSERLEDSGLGAGDSGLDLAAIRRGFEEDLGGLQTAFETRAKADAEARKRRALHGKWLASYSGLRKAARQRFRSFLLRQRDDVLRRLKKVGLPQPEATGNRQQATGGPSTVSRKSSIDDWLMSILFDLKEEDGKITALGRFLTREGLKLGGTQVGPEVQMPEDWAFNLEAPAVRRRLARQAIRVRKVNETTQKIIRRALLKGLDGGETLNEISDRVAKAMNVRAGTQSWRIANTEMHEAVAAGRHEGFKQANVKYQAWLTSGRGVEPNGPVRTSHWDAEQATQKEPIKVGEPFTLHDPETGTKSQCLFPGDGSLPPGERINCSCVTIAKMTAGGKELSLDDCLEHGFTKYAPGRGSTEDTDT